MLGGGVTADPDDGLLRFKRKFAKGSSTFYIGMFLHDDMRYLDLCNQAVAADPTIASSRFFLKYRAQAKRE
jgi:hypothetical protein